MATQTVNIPEQLVSTTGDLLAARNLPASVTDIVVRIVSSDWFTATGTLDLRIEVRIGGVWQPVIERDEIPYGETDFKDGGLPKFGIGSDALIPADRVRAFARASVPINVGLTATVTSG